MFLLAGVFAVVLMALVVASGGARSLEMRSAEADFREQMETSGARARAERNFASRHAKPVKTAKARAQDRELSDWYGESKPGLVDPAGASTEPVDESYLINDTRPFGAPAETAVDAAEPVPPQP